jgi:hypothetical protein
VIEIGAATQARADFDFEYELTTDCRSLSSTPEP